MNEYLALDSEGYQSVKSLGSLIVWLDDSHRSRDGVRLNRSAREENVSRFEQSRGLNTALYKNLPFWLNRRLKLYGVFSWVCVSCCFVGLILL